MGEAGIFQNEHLLILRRMNWPDSWLDHIRRRFPRLEITSLDIDTSKPLEENVPKDILERATVIALMTQRHLPLPESVPNIKLVHTFSAGADGLINEPYIKNTDLPLTTSSGIHGPPISEWVLLNWLVSSKHYNSLYEGQKRHEWISRQYVQVTQSDHVGKRVAILGYGSIGRQIGRIAVSLGAKVYAYTASAHETPESREDRGYIVPGTGDSDGIFPVEWHHGTSKDDLRRFLRETKPDHVVISLPLTTATYHLFDSEEFEVWSDALSPSTISSANEGEKFPPRKGFLTNISRGKIVNTDALLTALEKEQIRGAALDVTDPEPLPADHPLWDAKNVQISPHISWSGQEYFVRALDVLKINLEKLERGEELVNLFHRRRGY
ncbi:2-hydroxyacid dehydrogenase, putative [Talaromyces stipitatus ATCC 10500]|uniref:2-hydroxyacid dehydrogenase, putative n=1 Tax=Talaromyces stipitatus (strain ATCC 10500 / CBS 375.48 / QM 6759 / NRRL 1006) TaxID=441959 RepID=B8MQF7_TALSN|nr:2-hydroxyacid dehydrogenase, putative [Talaromyces stipitatus ATCC 10500]EED13359.1 2-hydroxyacid dehydrogenase, putative [Talaromyces stipitatus ATCC 10500]